MKTANKSLRLEILPAGRLQELMNLFRAYAVKQRQKLSGIQGREKIRIEIADQDAVLAIYFPSILYTITEI